MIAQATEAHSPEDVMRWFRNISADTADDVMLRNVPIYNSYRRQDARLYIYFVLSRQGPLSVVQGGEMLPKYKIIPQCLSGKLLQIPDVTDQSCNQYEYGRKY